MAKEQIGTALAAFVAGLTHGATKRQEDEREEERWRAYYDLAVNRDRIEAERAALHRADMLRAQEFANRMQVTNMMAEQKRFDATQSFNRERFDWDKKMDQAQLARMGAGGSGGRDPFARGTMPDYRAMIAQSLFAQDPRAAMQYMALNTKRDELMGLISKAQLGEDTTGWKNELAAVQQQLGQFESPMLGIGMGGQPEQAKQPGPGASQTTANPGVMKGVQGVASSIFGSNPDVNFTEEANKLVGAIDRSLEGSESEARAFYKKPVAVFKSPVDGSRIDVYNAEQAEKFRKSGIEELKEDKQDIPAGVVPTGMFVPWPVKK